MFRKFCLSLLLIVANGAAYAQQGVAINTDGTAPHSSAMLDVKSTTKGMLVPRMTSVQRVAIATPLRGLLVYDNTTNGFWFFNGTVWEELVSNPNEEWVANNNNIYSSNSGNVGIGNTNPVNKLDITGNVRIASAGTPTLKFEGADLFSTSSIIFHGNTGSPMASINHAVGMLEFKSGNHNNQLFVSNNGGINIGHNNGTARLDINALNFSGDALQINDEDPTIQLQSSGVDKGFLQLAGDNIRIGTNSSNSTGQFVIRTGGGDRIFVDNAGNMSLGSNLKANGYKLSVDGKVMCEELKVQLSGAWPDYVFQNNYKLRSIPELEKYINENGHLPGIPSAANVESNGLSVGDMQKRMMEKVEELTLYIIELNKQVDALKNKSK